MGGSVLLKALLFTALCGLIGAKLPLWVSYPALWLLPIAEIVYMTIHHDDFALHRLGIGYLMLLSVGLASFYSAVIWLLADFREKAR